MLYKVKVETEMIVIANSDKEAIDIATAFFQYYCTFGTFEDIITDPGSEYTAEVIKHLHQW